jgi:oligopeptidase B
MPSRIHDRTLPPMPPKRRTERNYHGERVIDPYDWLRECEDPRVRLYIDEENAYTKHSLAHTGALRRQLYEEMLDRIDLNRVTVPVRDGCFEYYSRNEENKPYPIHYRRHLASSAPEELVLDENVLADGKSYFVLEFLSISPDHRRCIFSIDTTGDERLSLFVKELGGDKSTVTSVPGAAAGVAWANDNQTFFSIRLDERNRPFQLVRHHLAQGSISEDTVFEERDEAFRLRLGRTESGQFIIATSWAHDTTELHYLNANEPTAPIGLLRRREAGVEAYATHHGQAFYIITNEDAPRKKIIMAPIANPMSTKGVFMDTRPDVEISHMQVFAGHFVLCERREGLSHLRIINLLDGEDHLIALPEPVYTIHQEDNREFETAIFRFGYSSLTTPYTVYDYDMASRRLDLRQQGTVKRYNLAAYGSERVLVSTADGVQVPLSLVYRRGLRRDGSHPALLYGYGAYGYCLEAEFSSLRLSLLERGFTYAIAHVRGGGELGQEWHAQGKAKLKHTSFSDFIACAEYLIRENYTSAERLAIMGESAGGLLAAAAINERPELFAAVVVDGPFVDVVNTLADETLPFTISEWKEWGNPSDPADYACLRSYSPYENVRKQEYPAILVLCSFSDPRVPYWEGIKWAARIRTMATNQPEVLIKVRLEGGHQGVSDRFAEVDEWALIYAFIIRRVSKRISDSVDRRSCLA